MSKLEKIASQDELCKHNIDEKVKLMTDIKGYFLFPTKIRFNYCMQCDSYVQHEGIDYCLRRVKE